MDYHTMKLLLDRFDAIDDRLDDIAVTVDLGFSALIEKDITMTASVQRAIAAIAAANTLDDKVIAFLTSITQTLRDVQHDPAALDAAINSLDQRTVALAAAFAIDDAIVNPVAEVPADPAPVDPAPVDPAPVADPAPVVEDPAPVADPVVDPAPVADVPVEAAPVPAVE